MNDLAEIVDFVLGHARKLGADDAEISITQDTGFSVSARLGAVETIERHQQQGMQLTVYKNRSKGTSSTNDLKPEFIKKSVEAALSIAAYTAQDPCAGLAPAELLAHEYPDLQLCHHWEVDPRQALAMAVSCEEAARQNEKIKNSEGATVSSVESRHAYGNTHGFTGAYSSSQHSVSCSVVAQDDSGMQRDYWYSIARSPEQLQPIEQIGQQASTRAVSRLGARKLNTCAVPVLFEPALARGLIGHLVAALSGGALYRNASFLKDRLEQQLFPNWLTITERPHLPGALGSVPFDQDGVALEERRIVESGVLKGYVLSHYSACRLGMQTTGNAGGIHNLELSNSNLSQADMIRDMNRGLLITELIGHGVNTVTGDYSRGAAGFWIEQGEIQYPVEEITIAGNLEDMFKGIVSAGNDLDQRGKICCGSLLIDQMMVAGS